jgi:hypothetical protein
MIVSLFIGAGIQGKVGGWTYYVLVDNSLVSDRGYVIVSKYPDLEKFVVTRAVRYLKTHHQKIIDSGVKVRVHTSYEGDIDLPSYEKINNEHYLQTNADIYAMEIAKRHCP